MSSGEPTACGPFPPNVQAAATIELRCGTCGYGVIVRVAPETCPMCHGTVWDRVATIDADGKPESQSPRAVTPPELHLDNGRAKRTGNVQLGRVVSCGGK